jgi:23S rRNA pseudouridine2605 synthase
MPRRKLPDQRSGGRPVAPAASPTAGGAERSAEPRLERLHKVLASRGLGSRRQCEALIEAGRVEVDGRVVTELGTKVAPHGQEIRVDSEPLPRTTLVYYMINKPDGVVSTNRDPAGRPRVVDLVPHDEHLFAVGRLDLHSEGLILVTNDGELANLLTHPRYEVEKVYRVQVAGEPTPEALSQLRQGVRLAEGFARAKRVVVRSRHKHSTILEITLAEGRNREVRRLLARIGHKVQRLKRIAVGPLRLGELPPGEFRPLRGDEVRALRGTALATERGGAARVAPRARGSKASRPPHRRKPRR